MRLHFLLLILSFHIFFQLHSDPVNTASSHYFKDTKVYIFSENDQYPGRTSGWTLSSLTVMSVESTLNGTKVLLGFYNEKASIQYKSRIISLNSEKQLKKLLESIQSNTILSITFENEVKKLPTPENTWIQLKSKNKKGNWLSKLF